MAKTRARLCAAAPGKQLLLSIQRAGKIVLHHEVECARRCMRRPYFGVRRMTQYPTHLQVSKQKIRARLRMSANTFSKLNPSFDSAPAMGFTHIPGVPTPRHKYPVILRYGAYLGAGRRNESVDVDVSQEHGAKGTFSLGSQDTEHQVD